MSVPGRLVAGQKAQRHAVLWGFIILAALLRLGAAFYLGDTLTGDRQERAFDQVSYNALAQSLLAGKGYAFDQDWYPGFTRAGQQTAHWSFLYPLYLAGVYAISGYHLLAARLVQALICGVLSIWLIYRLGRRLACEQVGLLAAGLGSVYAYFVYYDAALMTESFFIVGVLAMLELSIAIVEQLKEGKQVGGALAPGVGWWLGLGTVLGVTALLRQTILLWLPFLFLWIIWAGRGRVRLWGLALTCVITVLLILPWTVRNYVVYRAFLPLNSNAGYALYSANHPDHGTRFDQDYAAPLPDDLLTQELNEAQWNTALTARGLEFILQDPCRYLLLSLNRVGVHFNFWFSSESSLSSNLMRVLSYGLYMPFLLYGLILSLRNWQRNSLIYLFALMFSLLHILTWAGIRYRLPVDAALMPFAALALLDLVSRLQARFPALPISKLLSSFSPD